MAIAFGLASLRGESLMQPATTTTALVGATLIDGNGGSPIGDATIVIAGS